MHIHSNHLKYKDFIKNEISTLKFLQGFGYLSKEFPSLIHQAYVSYFQYSEKIKKKKSSDFAFEFNCEIELEIEKKTRTVIIEALILPKFKHFSYMFAICSENDESSELLRKFHFDFALPVKNEFPKPVYHLQYGGEATPLLSDKSISVEPLLPWLSQPRINHTPINLALMLDAVFTEFRSQNEFVHGIVERKEWRDLVKTNEEAVLKPYYEGLNQFFSSKHKSDFLLRDYIYGGNKSNN